MTATKTRAPWRVWPLLLVLLPLVAIAFVLWLAAAIVLQLIVWTAWFAWSVRPRGVLEQSDLAGVL
jgi:hypothetical protein